MSSSDLIYMRHLLDAAQKSVDFASGGTRANLDADEMLALALVRLLEIIGEASRNISAETRLAHSDIPWRQMAATRNRLIHGYFDVDLDIVWSIVATDLPPLIPKLHEMIAELEKAEGNA